MPPPFLNRWWRGPGSNPEGIPARRFGLAHLIRGLLRLSGLIAIPLLPLHGETLVSEWSSQPLREQIAASSGETLFTLLTPEETNVRVVNVFDDPRMWGDRFREMTLGSIETGIAIADFDLDGQPDIFAISKNGPCALYRQVSPFVFVDVAEVAGVTCPGPANNTGATAVDINQDGAMDLYVCRYDGTNLLFINDGQGFFEERAADFGLDIHDASVHAAFADYDRDGDLDAYLVTNILNFAEDPLGRRDYLLQNNGDGSFSNVAEAAGIWGRTQGHTAIWFDPNDDGWPDLYVANDFETPDRFYLNQGDGTFADVVDERLPHVTYFSMGADAGDINNDGLIDFVVSDMRDRTHAGYMTGIEEIGRGLWEMERVDELIPQYMRNAFYLNSGTDRFQEAAYLLGMDATGWTFGTRLADLDNDGRLDAFYTTGMIRNFLDADRVDLQNRAPSLVARARVWKEAPPRIEPNLAFRNLGNLEFADVSEEWGLDDPGVSFGCALADLDGDGDLDLVYSNFQAPPGIVRNNTAGRHRVAFRLVGHPPNRDAIGAEVTIETAAGIQTRQLFTERGIVASEPPLVHFGLGGETVIARATIRWPLGREQVLENLPVDRLITIPEPPNRVGGGPAVVESSASATPDRLLIERAEAFGLDFTGASRPVDEFTRQRLLPRRLGDLGPAIAAGDVNGDGRDDVFIAGQRGQSGMLYLAENGAGFAPASDQPWASAVESDDLGAAFADVDGDGDLDLVVASGGVATAQGDPALNDRLYLNDGAGNFSPGPDGGLPGDGESTAAVAFGDFDDDGWPDLFVGGRVVPGQYPETPRSFLYRNRGDGTFEDVTDAVAPALRSIGMVTAAEWGDLDGDGLIDLVVTREWGSVVCLRNEGEVLDISASVELDSRSGWWSALELADLNEDGRLDLVVGNVGLNTKYRASMEEPTVLLAGVFDRSGNEYLVEAQFEDGQLMPLRGRSKLAYSFPWMRRKYATFEAFSNDSVEDIFGSDRLAEVTWLTASELASGIFINRSEAGRMFFEFRQLPREAQLAPINALAVRDFNRDGHLDIVCAGNHFGPEPSTGRFNGGLGLMLLGDGDGGFEALSPGESGFAVPGETRSLVPVDLGIEDGVGLLVGRTDGPVLFFVPADLE